MSIHKSLKRKDSLVRRRNVLSRGERIERLKTDERWREGGTSVFGLPKVKPQIVSAPSRPKAKEKPEAAVAPTGEAAAAEAPQAAAKSAKQKDKGREKE